MDKKQMITKIKELEGVKAAKQKRVPLLIKNGNATELSTLYDEISQLTGDIFKLQREKNGSK